ncbi:Platelet endothelial cell adhesion molecule [Merluccius polli]|uniref:Platelet endothelial cell adhesion molecule n=1 Tax=Merluccius polli TaxID=89951 RepID=A0AA47MKM5_MERPO|nr:Platelet endothelial cell adhesion molecule [Merluccius polli]
MGELRQVGHDSRGALRGLDTLQRKAPPQYTRPSGGPWPLYVQRGPLCRRVARQQCIAPRLSMDPRTSCSLLLLAGILIHSLYTIDEVGLSIAPGPTVVTGTAVTLWCQVNVSHDSSRRLTHTFHFVRDDLKVYTINTTDSEALYRLDPARADDSGAYECRVEVKEKVKSSLGQKLTVTGLLTPDLRLSSNVLYESEELVATCSAPQEKGALNFKFFKQSQSGDVTLIKQVASAGNWSETKLPLRDIGGWDIFCNYSIPKLSQTKGYDSSSNKTKVLVKGIRHVVTKMNNFLPCLFIVPVMNVLPSTRVFEGDLVEVVCKVISPPPGNISVYLTKGRKVLKQGQVGLNHVFRVRQAGSWEYTCKSEYGAAQKESYTSIVVKELFSRPKLRLEPIEVFEGERQTIHCTIDSYAKDKISRQFIQFSIYKNSGSKNELVTKGDTYSFVAQASQNGNYTCQAQVSLETEIVKESATVVVKAIVPEPVSQPVLTLSPDAAHISEGQDLTLSCSVRKGTLPVNFTWYHTERKTPLDSQTSPVYQSSFTIPNVGRAHSGGYYCESSNLANNVKKSVTVVVPIAMAGWKKGLITLLCVLLLMGVILAVLFKKGLLRRKRAKELSVKSVSTHPERMSLTKVEVSDAVNDTDEQNSLVSPEEPEPQYTEVQTRQPDPSRACPSPPTAKEAADTVNSEARNSKQGNILFLARDAHGVSEEAADGGSVEYAQLNNDSGRNSGHRKSGGIQPDNVDDIDELDNSEAATVHEDGDQDPPTPDC